MRRKGFTSMSWICYHISIYLYILLLRSHVVVEGIVNLPGVEFNAATGQSAYASSYYNYEPNVLRDTKFLPANAIDGFVDESSWWSSGTDKENVFWQLNITSTPPRLTKIVIRWHGFLAASSYRIRVSYAGQNFQTIAVIVNKTMEYDRIDSITEGLEGIDTRFQYMRIVMDSANICNSEEECKGDDVISTRPSDIEDPTSIEAPPRDEKIIFGIREFELWATGSKNGKFILISRIVWLIE
jgi:hypothetical protein